MKRIGALLLTLVMVLSLTTGAMAAGSDAKLDLSAVRTGKQTVLTVSLSDAQSVTNGQIIVTYDASAVVLTSVQALGQWGAVSINDENLGQVSLAWVGSQLTSEKTDMAELTFVTVGTGDAVYTAGPGELYADGEKQNAASAEITCPYNPFTDIDGHWAEEDIIESYYAGLFAGVTDTTFDPNGNLTRGQLVTVLYRLAGCPDTDYVIPFTDVKDSAYYADAVAWATEVGVTAGISETAFAPNRAATRQELIAMLYRYATISGQDVSGRADLSGFVDSDRVSGWAKDSMAWAVELGLIQGYVGGYLCPDGNATRAQAAAIFCRYGNQ